MQFKIFIFTIKVMLDISTYRNTLINRQTIKTIDILRKGHYKIVLLCSYNSPLYIHALKHHVPVEPFRFRHISPSAMRFASSLIAHRRFDIVHLIGAGWSNMFWNLACKMARRKMRFLAHYVKDPLKNFHSAKLARQLR